MSIKRNFLYNSLITVSGYIFPLITYPYVSRVLGATNIGVVNFIDSLINYFVIFSMMGIATVGVREIARANKAGRRELDATFTSLVLLTGLFTLISLAALVAAMLFVPKLAPYRALLEVGALKLLGNFCLLEWLYSGLEQFRYIALRTLAVKTLYMVSVFVFVRTSDDYLIYFFLMTMMIVLNAAINCGYARRFVTLRRGNGASPGRFAKPLLIVGSYAILTSMYTTFNVAWLGFVSPSTDQVGFYTTAVKLFTILLALYTAFTNVMLPRLSALAAEARMEEFRRMIRKAVDCLMAFAVPLILFTMVFSHDIVDLLAGKGYEGAYTPTRIIMPLIFVVGYSQILVLQVLMPLHRDGAILANSVLGAFVGVTLNLLLASRFLATGSAAVWLVSELCVMASAQYFVWRIMRWKFPLSLLLKNVAAYVPALVVCLLILHYQPGPGWLRLGVAAVVIAANMVAAQHAVLRNEVFLELEQCVRARLGSRSI